MEHNKLVRDKIPSIILENGDNPSVKFLTREEYIEELNRKLDEEHDEFNESLDIEELLDMVEVIYAIASTRGVSESTFDDWLYQKREKRGGFDSRIFLISTHRE